MKTWVGIAVGLTALSWLPGFPRPARGCSTIGPGINTRSTWPGPDSAIPTNARFVVSYFPGGSGVPTFGPDLMLLDADGTQIPTTMEGGGSSVVIRASGDLLPNHGYQLADRRTIPCNAITGDCALAATPQVFASFTTGPGADTVAPTFAGVTGVAVANHLTCNSDACCGTYDAYVAEASWAAGSDDLAGSDIRYNVYRGSSLTLVAALVPGTSTSGTRICSGSFGDGAFQPGDYVVRAVDWAGNEDTNVAARHLDDPCNSGGGCSLAASPPPSDRSSWLSLVAMAIVAGRLRRRA